MPQMRRVAQQTEALGLAQCQAAVADAAAELQSISNPLQEEEEIMQKMKATNRQTVREMLDLLKTIEKANEQLAQSIETGWGIVLSARDNGRAGGVGSNPNNLQRSAEHEHCIANSVLQQLRHDLDDPELDNLLVLNYDIGGKHSTVTLCNCYVM